MCVNDDDDCGVEDDVLMMKPVANGDQLEGESVSRSPPYVGRCLE